MSHSPNRQSVAAENSDASSHTNDGPKFPDLGLAEPILRALDKEGYSHPTPIQEQVIPYLIEGRDVLGIAQTGTGKTAAFVLPLLHKIYETKSHAKPKQCTALILTPTRELANQVAASVDTYGRTMKVMTAIVVGGVKYGPQIKRLSGGVDVLIATPGRLEDLMKTGAISLAQTKNIVLDEADQMLDLGFAPAIRRILSALPKGRQTALLSATMEKKIRKLAQDFLTRPAEVSVTPDSKPIDRIEQGVVHLQSAVKRPALIKILSRPEMKSAIVFSRTKHGAEKLAGFIDKAGISAGSIHGNKNQRQRERALAAFRAGKTPVLVATDVAARGIDVDDVSHVINFDLPNVAEAYVHRIGRTGRAGRSGVAIAFCDSSERGLLRDIERLIKTSIPVITIDGIKSSEFVVSTDADEGGKRHRKGGGRGGSRREGGDRKRGGIPDWKKRTTDRNKRKKADAGGGADQRGKGSRAASNGDAVGSTTQKAAGQTATDSTRGPSQRTKPNGSKPGVKAHRKGGRPNGKPGGNFANKSGGKPGGRPGGKFAGKPSGKSGGKPGGKMGGRPGGNRPRTGGVPRSGGR